ncbi:hypothetical protein [Nocardia sp. NPDC060259]|uniref:hypothetical protein n=1 Tax=Nocardia sp. NPDC060259 TaxID=3347088 RepID=UPI003666ED90
MVDNMMGSSFDGTRDRAAGHTGARRDDPRERITGKREGESATENVAALSATTESGRQAHQVHRSAADERGGFDHVETFLTGAAKDAPHRIT